MDLSAGRETRQNKGVNLTLRLESKEKICQIEMLQNLSLTRIRVWAKNLGKEQRVNWIPNKRPVRNIQKFISLDSHLYPKSLLEN